MKKIITILLLLVVISLTSFRQEPVSFDIRESINTLEDMKEWMVSDMEQGYVDQDKGLMYIENIDITINRLRKLN